MITEYIRILLAPTATEGGGTGEGGSGTTTETDEENTEETGEENTEETGEETPPPPPKPKVKSSKKVQLSAEKLKELEDKARKLDEREQKDRDAQEARDRERLKKQTEADPKAALTTLQRKYNTDTQHYKKEIETITAERDSLRAELCAGVMDKRATAALNEALVAAKLEPVSEKAVSRMVAEIANHLEIERQADGSYEIFGKDDSSDMVDVIKKLVEEEFKDLYLKVRRSEPAGSGNSTRRPLETTNGEVPKQRTWREAFAARKKVYEDATGDYVPSIGLKPKPKETSSK
jgi:Skp family chaperone for outer membrane proteins